MNTKNRSRLFLIFSYVVTTLFLVSAAVQYNDPDGIYWIVFYGAAALITWLFIKDRLHWVIPGLLAMGVLVGAGLLGFDVISNGTIDQVMGRSWQMQNLVQEKARESGGMLVVGIWLLVLALRIWKNPDHGPQ